MPMITDFELAHMPIVLKGHTHSPQKEIKVKFDYAIDQIRNIEDQDEVLSHQDEDEELERQLKEKQKRDKLALNYKKRVSDFMNDMTFQPVVQIDPYLMSKVPKSAVRKSAQNVSVKNSLMMPDSQQEGIMINEQGGQSL